MKKLIASCFMLLLLAGCLTTPTPVVTPAPGGGTQTNYLSAPAPWVGQTQAGVSAVAPFIPPPWGTIIGGAGILLGTVASAYAASQNNKAKSATAVSQSIIEGVESLGTAAAPVKVAVANAALANGNADKVNDLVQKTV